MTSEVTLIYNFDIDDDGYATVIAIVEDSRIIRAATRFDPPEYGPGVCKSGFYIGENDNIPLSEDELIEYINEQDLDWEIHEDYLC
jgi:hypothetical protein